MGCYLAVDPLLPTIYLDPFPISVSLCPDLYEDTFIKLIRMRLVG